MSKVVISNAVTLNTGDAAILYGIIKGLKYLYGEKLEITVFDKNHLISQSYYKDIKFQNWIYNEIENNISNKLDIKYIRRIVKKINKIRFLFGVFLLETKGSKIGEYILYKNEIDLIKIYIESNIIISTGGTYLVENYSQEARIFDYKLTLILNKPLVFFTQSLGPFKRSTNIKAFSSIFNKASNIFIRDKVSKDNLLDIGVHNPNISLASDAAFLLTKENLPNRPLLNFKQKRLSVAISVRNWENFKEKSAEEGMYQYKLAIAEFAQYIIREHKAKVTFISTCQGIPEYTTDDSEVAVEIVDTMNEHLKSSIVIDQLHRDPISFQNKLSNYDMMVGTRMHACILALTVGVPIIPISYEFKTHELAKKMNVEDLLIDIENVNCSKLCNKFNSLIKNYDVYSELMTSATKNMKNEAESVFNKFEIL